MNFNRSTPKPEHIIDSMRIGIYLLLTILTSPKMLAHLFYKVRADHTKLDQPERLKLGKISCGAFAKRRGIGAA